MSARLVRLIFQHLKLIRFGVRSATSGDSELIYRFEISSASGLILHCRLIRKTLQASIEFESNFDHYYSRPLKFAACRVVKAFSSGNAN